jgi:hypothetical protein
MNLEEVKMVTSHQSPIGIKVFRWSYRLFCIHDYKEDAAICNELVSPILVKECIKCGNRKYKSMDGE